MAEDSRIEPQQSNPLIRARLLRRFFAGIIDTLFLGFVGTVLSIPFSEIFFALGQNGSWIGGLIALAYFTFSQSKYTRGQTLGYKLLGIRVITMGGASLSFKNSFIRSFLFLLPSFGYSLTSLVPNLMAGQIWSIVLACYAVSLLVFVLFHPLHRGLHDLASGAIVVNRKQYETLTDDDKRKFFERPVSLKRPQIISGIALILIFGVGIAFLFMNPLKTDSLSDLVNLQQTLNEIPGISVHTVQIQKRLTLAGEGELDDKGLLIGVSVERMIFIDKEKLDFLEQQIDSQIVSAYPDIQDLDYIKVTFSSGYNIGILTFNENANYASSVKELLGVSTSTVLSP